MYPASIQKLIEQFAKFPTVGPRTAARFVFYLIKLPQEKTEKLADSIKDLKEKIKLCDFCFNPFEPAYADRGPEELCEICRNPKRDKSLICVVEKESDLEAIEKTKQYKGRYFILGGTVSKLKKEDVKKLRVDEFLERVKKPEITEIILATNSTPEGENTALYLERLLEPKKKKTTRLGRGLPVGSELEYADEETLSSALESRR